MAGKANWGISGRGKPFFGVLNLPLGLASTLLRLMLCVFMLMMISWVLRSVFFIVERVPYLSLTLAYW